MHTLRSLTATVYCCKLNILHLMSNSSGYGARITQENLTGGNMSWIIDTLPPTLTLNGNNNSISAIGKPYTELNATAYDLSYGSKNIAPTIAGTVNMIV